MKAYTGNITPDSLSGAVFAIEGIADGCTVLNGPTGCKFYHSAISDSQFLRNPARYGLISMGEFYFGMPRVPSTYLDGNDYVFSSREKLRRLLQSIPGGAFGIIAVINSPGAALIGDDLGSFLESAVKDIPFFALETAGFSGTFGAGFQKAVAGAIDVLCNNGLPLNGAPLDGKPVREKTVNLLGLGIYQKYFEGNRRCLERLLNLCGVEVLCAPGAGDGAAAFSGIPEAALNIAVYPEFSLETAEKLRAGYGTPFLAPSGGPPVGFDATETFLREVCAALAADPAPALALLDQARARAYLYLTRYTAMNGVSRGMSFSISAEASTAYAITKWLTSYLGMIPAAVAVQDEGETPFTGKLEAYLASINHADSLRAGIHETPAHIILGDGNTIAAARLEGGNFGGIEISLPTLNYLDITEKTLFGEQGALFLLEQIVNGIRYVA